MYFLCQFGLALPQPLKLTVSDHSVAFSPQGRALRAPEAAEAANLVIENDVGLHRILSDILLQDLR